MNQPPPESAQPEPPRPEAARPVLPPPPPCGPPIAGAAAPNALPAGAYLTDPALRPRTIGAAYAGLGFFAFVFSFLPWASVYGISAAGVEGDGVMTLLLGLLLMGLGATRFVARPDGLSQLGVAVTALVSSGLVLLVAFATMLNISGTGAEIGAGLVLTLVVGLAGLPVGGLDLVGLWREEPTMTEHPQEHVAALVAGVLAGLGVAVLGPAAVAVALLQLRRARTRATLPTQETARKRPMLIGAIVGGGVGILWLVIFFSSPCSTDPIDRPAE